jgi:sigma-B regulation protein RsbU (phosphoserine phosphatase)
VRAADVPPMGIFPRLGIGAATSVHLEPGDVFAVLSDGFFEAVGEDGEVLGRERVKRVLLAARTASAHEILAALVREVDAFTGGRPAADDRTGLVLKRVR